jgi:hypothetical protein
VALLCFKSSRAYEWHSELGRGSSSHAETSKWQAAYWLETCFDASACIIPCCVATMWRRMNCLWTKIVEYGIVLWRGALHYIFNIYHITHVHHTYLMNHALIDYQLTFINTTKSRESVHEKCGSLCLTYIISTLCVNASWRILFYFKCVKIHVLYIFVAHTGQCFSES